MSLWIRPFASVIAAAFLVGAFAAPAADIPDWQGRPPYGKDLMTDSEKKTYWREFLALRTDADRDAYWDAHVEKMKQRAVERGVSMPKMFRKRSTEPKKPRFWGPPYFEEMMTEEEIENYYPSLEAIPDRLDQTRFVAAHIRTMYARALERGVSAPLTVEFDYIFETLGEDPPDLADRPKQPNSASDEEEDDVPQAPTDGGEEEADELSDDGGDDVAASAVEPRVH